MFMPQAVVITEFFDTVIREIVAMDNELIVTGGDWNVALNPIFWHKSS